MPTNNNEFIYALTIDGETVYVGRTNDPARRLGEHLRDNSGSPKSVAIQNAKEKGQIVKMETIVTVERGCLGSMEDDEIEKIISNGGKLLNQIGGNRDDRLSAAEAARWNKDIQHFKATHKPKKGDLKPDFSDRPDFINQLVMRFARGEVSKEHFEAVALMDMKRKRGECSLEDVREFCENGG